MADSPPSEIDGMMQSQVVDGEEGHGGSAPDLPRQECDDSLKFEADKKNVSTILDEKNSSLPSFTGEVTSNCDNVLYEKQKNDSKQIEIARKFFLDGKNIEEHLRQAGISEDLVKKFSNFENLSEAEK